MSIIFLCSGNFVSARVDLATSVPDRIVLNLVEDASTSVAVTWRTDTSISSGYCELQPTPDGRTDHDKSISFKAKTSTYKYKFDGRPTVSSNQHSFIFTGLKPGGKYIYRVGSERFWSEWFDFETPSTENDKFSFLYFGDPQNDIKSLWSRVLYELTSQKTWLDSVLRTNTKEWKLFTTFPENKYQ